MRTDCYDRGQQRLKVFYTVSQKYSFSPDQDQSSESFDEQIATAIISAADGEIDDYEVLYSDTNVSEVIPGTTYCIEITLYLTLSGTCIYDPGRVCGPMEDCYPPEIDDVDLDSGMVTDVDTYIALSACPSIVDTLDVEILDADAYGDITVADEY